MIPLPPRDSLGPPIRGRALYLSVIIGFWLIVSTLVWPYGAVQGTNTFVAGIVVIALAIASARWPRTRPLTAIVGAWIVASAWVLPSTYAVTKLHHAVAGFALMVLSRLGRGRPAELLSSGPLTRPWKRPTETANRR